MRVLLLSLLGAAIVVPLGFRIFAALRETGSAALLRPADGQMVKTSMGTLHVLEMGPTDGPPLLLLHGTAAWSGLWRPVLEALAQEGYRAVGMDMPPFGFSDRDPEGDYSRQRQAARVIALADALHIKPVLIAHSFGAGAGVEATMIAPERFAGLVVVDGAIGIAKPTEGDGTKAMPLPLRVRPLRELAVALTATNPLMTRRLLASLLYVKDAATDEVVRVLQRPMRIAGSTRAFADWLPSLLVPPAGARSTDPANYRDFCLPTGIIWGSEDSITPVQQGERLTGLIAGSSLTLIPETGHIPQIESPAAFIASLRETLQALRSQHGC
ncbi:alpha/beta hydrolase [Paracoccus aurantiacus]|uniref:Alpha/beta hydrolase n=1 Tax=Paracoccus aurantiacus TaxID=2599412 RepID=A0A5C6S120_9RHOB|nr:alpha/beta hydrolase [Paracoccus aurantiacus]TXB68063.1 alpha/beta hydrolase [Paracoccus aurantiacus]